MCQLYTCLYPAQRNQYELFVADEHHHTSLAMATEVEMPISMMPMHQAPESSSPSSTGAPGSAAKQTPSPSASASGQSSAGLSKRPPRKSTLTQQQKNQKRQRATQEQLATLEVEFNKNPTPTANVRERIAEEINMTERSVQIWFQNRYVIPGADRARRLQYIHDSFPFAP